MEFRPAQEYDLLYVSEHSISGECFKEPDAIDWVYALEDEGKILGVGGVKLMNPHSAWVWFSLSDHAKSRMITVYRILVTWLETWTAEKGITRLMASVDVDFEEGIRTATHLGFHRESRMEKFLGDRDAWLYVRLSEV